MGVNENSYTRAHRKCCCRPDWPISIQLDWTPFRKFWKFRYDRNGRGDFFLDGFGLWLRICPHQFLPTWERKRLAPFWDQQWKTLKAKLWAKWTKQREAKCATNND